MELAALLKEQTAPLHKEVERAPALAKLMGEGLTQQHYARVVAKWYGLMQPFEQLLLQQTQVLAPILPQWQERMKTPLLESDLAALGQHPTAIELTDTLTKQTSLPAMLGTWYVLEGSTLGSQFIVRQLATNSWFNSEMANFYSGYGAKTGSMWKQFKTVLNGRPDEEAPAMIDAAQNTFSAIGAWMNT